MWISVSNLVIFGQTVKRYTSHSLCDGRRQMQIVAQGKMPKNEVLNHEKSFNDGFKEKRKATKCHDLAGCNTS